MSPLTSWFTRALNVLRPDRVSRDIQREMAFHVAERADELVAGGMLRGDAERAARRQFGRRQQLHETTRDADMLLWLESVASDVKQAARSLRASPGFTIVAVLSLALGIGANTAIFSLINAVMLRALPVADPSALVTITSANFGTEWSNPIWESFRDRQRVLSGAAAFSRTSFDLSDGGEVRRVSGSWVSGSYFSTLGVNAAAGRLLTPGDDAHGCAATAVISYGFWQSELGGKESAVGSAISLAHHPFTIVGVTPPEFFGAEVGKSIAVYVPLCAAGAIGAGDMLTEKHGWFLNVIGRLAPEQTASRAAQQLVAITQTVLTEGLPPEAVPNMQATPAKFAFQVVPGVGTLSGARQTYSRALFTLMAVVALVLCIGCANVANLLLARATARQREIAVRFALGASRLRVVRQLLTETMLLATLGAAVGVLFARWSTGLLLGLLGSSRNPVTLDVPLDVRVLLFTTVMATVTALLFGLAPAWRSTRTSPHDAMRANARGIASGHSRFSIAKLLVGAQVALSLVLVIGAGLLLGTFRALANTDLGFTTDHVLIAHADFGNTGLPDDEVRLAQTRMLDALATVPGVRAVSMSLMTPVEGGAWNGGIAVDGYTPAKKGDALVYMNEVSGTYFATLQTPLTLGRTFDDHEQVNGPKTAVINETAMKKFFGGRNPVGQTFHMPGRKEQGPPYEVIGVVADTKYGSVKEEPRPLVFLPTAQSADPSGSKAFTLRLSGETRPVVSAVTALALSINPRIALDYRTLDNQIAASLTRERLLATLSVFFGVLALLLATIGLYGTMSYSVQRRRTEIGVRLALGAARTTVFGLVLREVGVMLVAGLAVGTVAALGTTRFVASFLYGVTPTDARTVAVSILVLSTVAIAAGAIPAWRAARLDPMASLREE